MNTILVMAGGTGGHIYPAMAVAEVLRSLGWHIVWLATPNGMENRLIADKAYQVVQVEVKGIRGKALWQRLMGLWQVLRACVLSVAILRQVRPNVVLGMGGFVSFPGGVASRVLGIPLVIHEQNTIAGLSNRVLMRLTRHVLTAFPGVGTKKARVVGNPVRLEMTRLEGPGFRFVPRRGALRLVVVGGSLGARVLNQVVPRALARFAESERPEVVHQSGEAHIEMLHEAYQAAQVKASIHAFIDDMASLYAWADVVICRAGAMTVAELSAVGVASILVPFAQAVDDHQTANARYLVAADAAWMIAESAFTPEELYALLHSLTRQDLLQKALRAHRLAKPEAARVVGEVCIGAAR